MDRFSEGYACCLANIIRSHGSNTDTKDAYMGCFAYKTENDLLKLGIPQHDIDVFKNEGWVY